MGNRSGEPTREYVAQLVRDLRFPPLHPALRVTPVPGEVVVSLAERLDAHCGAPPGNYVNVARGLARRLLGKVPGPRTDQVVLAELLVARCRLRRDQLHPHEPLRTTAWHTCPDCGPVVEVVASCARYACRRHARWTGPTAAKRSTPLAATEPAPDHGVHLRASTLDAIIALESLTENSRPRSDELLRRALSQSNKDRRAVPSTADVIFASALAGLMSDQSMWTGLDSSPSVEDAYALVERAARAHARLPQWPPDVTALTVHAWMLLRFAVGERLTEQGLVIEVDPICSAFSAPRSAKFSALAADFARWLAAVDAATLRQSSIRDLYCASPGAASAPGASVWVCDAGHGLERTAPPAWSRRRTFPCQVCSGDRAVEGINSLADSDPDTAAQWCYEHNGQLLPSDVTRGEKRLVCRICDAGHHSPATVINLVSASGCRLCHRERPYCGAQSVARAAPNLLRWWHPTRNLPVTPQSASAATSTLRWWTCAEGHAFEQSVASRRRCARGGEGQCLVCTRRRLQVGINDLTTAEPAIALDWDDDENPTLACRTLANPMRKGVWRCRFGHVVSTTIHDRVVTGGCKLCAPSFRVGRPNTRAGDASKAARHPERVFLAFDDPADVAPERDLTNIEWTAVETYMVSVFPGSRRERRLVLDAILWVHRRGGRWMDLPQRYGPPSTPHLWWRRLCEHDEWRTIVDTLEGLADDASSCDAIAKELAEQQGHYVEVSIA